LLGFRKAGTLDRVRLVLLTNCTFDGIVYDVERVMMECLAIKPDLVFLWDEAWFAFACCHPIYRQRTGMASAARLCATLQDPAYAARHAEFEASFGSGDAAFDDEARVLETRLLPDPKRARVRVYATHSTHKTLTALRQGSMIHVWDQDFRDKTEEAFHEAYMTHTSTSPNYQILASLDVGRRQVELEGYELVQRQLELAMSLREQVLTHPLLKRYFRFLRVGDVVPPQYRESGVETYYNDETGWNNLEAAWRSDEFVLDPTRATLSIGATGVDGDTFKNKHLMDRYGIQINKTSRNTVLFMTNIGSTRSAVAYLIEVLVKIAREVDQRVADLSSIERRIHEKRVRSLTLEQPPLPDFSSFHFAFRGRSVEGRAETRDGDIRSAFFLSYDDENCEYIGMSEVREAIKAGRDVVSALFVIPYPPGFPIIVPGQVISAEILQFMAALDVREIHGFRPELGFRVFNEAALARAAQATAARAALALAGRAAKPLDRDAGAPPSEPKATDSVTRSEP
jgi:arginine decarboxylase